MKKTMLLMMFFASAALAQNNPAVVVDKANVLTQTIYDTSTIRLILRQLMIPESDAYKLEIIDTGQNGFGENDVLNIFVQESDSVKLTRVYLLEDVPPAVLEKVQAPKLEPYIRIDAENLPPEIYEKNEDPFFGILAALADGLQRNYQSKKPIKMTVNRDQKGVTVEFWNYDDAAMRYTPPPIRGTRETLAIRVVYSDTVFVAK
ncbi:MAG: hypothetical protein ACE5I1_04275 [bacterium]